MDDRSLTRRRSVRSLSRRSFVRLAAGGGAATLGARALDARAAPPAGAAPVATSFPPPPGTSRVRLAVAPNPVAVDAPFSVRVTGLRAGELVTVRGVVGTDTPWTATGTFQADTQGTVDLATQAPRAGTYRVADPMGLVWSALPPGGASAATPLLGAGSPELYPAPVTITAEIAGKVAARTTVVRRLVTPAVTSTLLYEQGMWGQLWQPASAPPAPAVLVLGGSEGGLGPFPVRTAALLATHGFAALGLAYFGTGSLPQKLADVPLEYFGKALAWLKQQLGVRGDRLAVLGVSRGGELALLLGATYPELQAVVSYSGSGVVFPSSPQAPNSPAWTYRGKPLPFAPIGADPADFPRAQIPVERTNGPVLMLAGADDKLWPSAALSRIALARLRRFHHPYADELHVYPDAVHGIVPPYVVTTADLAADGGMAQGDAVADADSWPRVLRLLASRLRR